MIMINAPGVEEKESSTFEINSEKWKDFNRERKEWISVCRNLSTALGQRPREMQLHRGVWLSFSSTAAGGLKYRLCSLQGSWKQRAHSFKE